MEVIIKIDFSRVFADEVALSDLIRDEITTELRNAVKKTIRNDRRFSELVKDTANLFFNSIELVRKK